MENQLLGDESLIVNCSVIKGDFYGHSLVWVAQIYQESDSCSVSRPSKLYRLSIWQTTETHFSHFSAIQHLVRALFLVYRQHLAVYPHGRRDRQLSVASFWRTLIPFMRTPWSPIPKASLLKIILLVRFQHVNFKGTQQAQVLYPISRWGDGMPSLRKCEPGMHCISYCCQKHCLSTLPCSTLAYILSAQDELFPPSRFFHPFPDGSPHALLEERLWDSWMAASCTLGKHLAWGYDRGPFVAGHRGPRTCSFYPVTLLDPYELSHPRF